MPPFIGMDFETFQPALQAALSRDAVRRLALMTRCDPSRLGVNTSPSHEWIIARDHWLIICPQCILASLRDGTPTYERARWRIASSTYCPEHRIPLVQVKTMPKTMDACRRLIPALSDIEKTIFRHVRYLEDEIARAHRGVPPAHCEGFLTAATFLQVLRDLTTFVVARWTWRPRRGIVPMHEGACIMRDRYPALFATHRKQYSAHICGRGQQLTMAAVLTPATRRVAMWLAMDVIRATPTPRISRWGDCRPQEVFLGNLRHEGWNWLVAQSRAWPAAYRSHYWRGILMSSTAP
jgi:hypothetical protein